MTTEELAREFTEIWDELDASQINSMLARNVNFDLLEFFVSYADRVAHETGLVDEADTTASSKELRERLPNLIVIGYLIRLLEERLDESIS